MATIVFFHAHPDDETTSTGGTIRKAADAGHRTVLVTATGGEHGEVADGFLAEGETLAARRVRELEASKRILGIARGELLGYVDSGMIGTPENDAPESFWRADVEEAAARLAAILDEERADVLTIYDDHGNYGHPDHIQVHRVGARAAELAGTQTVYEATLDRERMFAFFDELQAQGVPDLPDREEFKELGSPASSITTRVDVAAQIEAKREALRAHRSQIADTSFFLEMPPEVFLRIFGEEHFIRRSSQPGLLDDLA